MTVVVFRMAVTVFRFGVAVVVLMVMMLVFVMFLFIVVAAAALAVNVFSQMIMMFVSMFHKLLLLVMHRRMQLFFYVFQAHVQDF